MASFKADSETVQFVTLSLVTELMVEVLTLQQQVRILEAKTMLPKGSEMEIVSNYVNQQEIDKKELHQAITRNVQKRVSEITEEIKREIANQ